MLPYLPDVVSKQRTRRQTKVRKFDYSLKKVVNFIQNLKKIRSGRDSNPRPSVTQAIAFPLGQVQTNMEVEKVLHTGKAELRKHLQEHDQKAALSSEIRKSTNKPRISKNWATRRIRICDLAKLESRAITTQPRKLHIPKN